MELLLYSWHPFLNLKHLSFVWTNMWKRLLIMRTCDRVWACSTLSETECKNFRNGSEMEWHLFNQFCTEPGLFVHSSCHSTGSLWLAWKPLSVHQYSHNPEWFVFMYIYLVMMLMTVKWRCSSLWSCTTHFK